VFLSTHCFCLPAKFLTAHSFQWDCVSFRPQSFFLSAVFPSARSISFCPMFPSFQCFVPSARRDFFCQCFLPTFSCLVF
jgi:hypothetical protein